MIEMISGIRETVRNLAAFFVLSTVLLRLLPEGSYARYLKFFLGLLLAVSMLKPIASVLSEEDLFSEALSGSILAASGSVGTSLEVKESIAVASAGEWAALLSTYQGEIREQINEQIADLGVCVTEITVDEGEEVLTFVIAKTGESRESSAEGETGGVIRIEIPVISVFVEAGEGRSGGNKSTGESGSENTGESGEKSGSETSGTADLTADEIAVMVRTRIASACGIDEKSIKVVWQDTGIV